MAFGYHLMLDLHGCKKKALEDLGYCYKFLDELPDKIGMNKQSPPFIFHTPNGYPDKAGLSGWVPLVESGISIHTLTATGFISIDIYSCKKFNNQEVKKVVSDFFNPKEVDEKYVLRGEGYEERYGHILKKVSKEK